MVRSRASSRRRRRWSPGRRAAPPPGLRPDARGFPTVGSSLAAAPARCIAVPQGLRVRARRTTRLRIHVFANGQNIRNALVRVTLPGGKRVLPPHRRRRRSPACSCGPSRSGTLVIQADVCFGAERVTVRRAPARRSAPARYTG